MSLQRAGNLIRGMSWYHLGFAFFWALYSTGPFGNAAVATAAAQAFGRVEPTSIFICNVLQQTCLITTLAVLAIMGRHRERIDRRVVWALGAAMCLGLVLRWVAPHAGVAQMPVACAGSVVLGVASGAFMVAWQNFFANAGTERSVVCIPLSAALSVALSALIAIMPAIAGIVALTLVLPLAASASLTLCLRETEPYQAKPLTKELVGMLASDMARPVICVCVVGFVWKAVSHLNGGASDVAAIAATTGMVFAALLVAGLELFWGRGFDIMRLYQFIFPVVTGVLLLPVLLGSEWLPFLSGCLMFGFEILNLMLIITCAAYACKNHLKPSQVYVPCVGLSLVALLVGDIVGYAAEGHVLYDMTIMAGALFVCAYLLSVAMSLVSFAPRKRAQAVDAMSVGVPVQAQNAPVAVPDVELEEAVADAPAEPIAVELTDEAMAEPAPSERELLEAAIDDLAPAEAVSKREIDVLELYLHGCNVPTAAQKLYISENTVRSHTKSLYRKFGVHSRQELIGLFSA